jgi:hypothetical protein
MRSDAWPIRASSARPSNQWLKRNVRRRGCMVPTQHWVRSSIARPTTSMNSVAPQGLGFTPNREGAAGAEEISTPRRGARGPRLIHAAASHPRLERNMMKVLKALIRWLRERRRRPPPPPPPAVHSRPRESWIRPSNPRDRVPRWAGSGHLSSLDGEGLRALASAGAGLPTRSLQLPAPRRSRTHTRFGFYADGNLSNCPRGEGFE